MDSVKNQSSLVDMRAFFAAYDDWHNMFSDQCWVQTSSGADDIQCFNLSTVR